MKADFAVVLTVLAVIWFSSSLIVFTAMFRGMRRRTESQSDSAQPATPDH